MKKTTSNYYLPNLDKIGSLLIACCGDAEIRVLSAEGESGQWRRGWRWIAAADAGTR